MGSTYHQLFVHFIWGTYKRFEMITDDLENDLRRLINEKVIEKQSEVICFGCTRDHVHLLIKMHPAISVSEIIGEIKGYSSYVIANQIHPDGGFRWQGGFGALTVSRKEIPRLIKYIENQKEHHRSDDLQMEWES